MRVVLTDDLAELAERIRLPIVGPIRQTIFPLRLTMAMKLDSRLLITMLSGAKRASPSSNQ
jgi:hypothetical protein